MFCGEPTLRHPVGSITFDLRSVIHRIDFSATSLCHVGLLCELAAIASAQLRSPDYIVCYIYFLFIKSRQLVD